MRAAATLFLTLVIALPGCGSSDKSGKSAKTGSTSGKSTAAKGPGGAIDPALAKDLGQANGDQLHRAQAYLNCLGPRLNKTKLTLREGTAKGPPTIIGSLKRGTGFGISLAASPAAAKDAERQIRASGNKALFTKGASVIAFGGSHPTQDEITFIIGCSDKIG
jgi:hypothetical protein